MRHAYAGFRFRACPAPPCCLRHFAELFADTPPALRCLPRYTARYAMLAARHASVEQHVVYVTITHQTMSIHVD